MRIRFGVACALSVAGIAACAASPTAQPVSHRESVSSSSVAVSSTARSSGPTSIPSTTPTPTPTPTPAAVRYQTPPPGQPVDCNVYACVALTFDDGPSKGTTAILDALEAKGAHATFFALGKSVSEHPELVKRAADAGNVIATHGNAHTSFTKLNGADQKSDIEAGAAKIQAAGAPRPALLRPPYGEFDTTTQSLGWPIIMWSVDTQDWKNRDAQVTTANALAGVKPGAIVLMHDSQPSTAQALPGMIDALRDRGYVIVTVPELLGSPQPGTAYQSRAPQASPPVVSVSAR